MIILALLTGVAVGWLLANQHHLDDHDELPFHRHPSNPTWTPRSNLRLLDFGVYDYDDDGWEHDGGGAA